MTDMQPRSARFSTAVLLLVSTAAMSYVLIDLAGINTPRFYPVLHTWSIAPIDGAIGMGFYGRFATAALVAVVITLLYLAVSSILARLGVVRTFAFAVKANITIWFTVGIVIVEEWSEWGVTKRGLDAGTFFNAEFSTFAVALGVVLVGALMAAFGLLRVERAERLAKTRV